ncbi:MAG: AAA family ATPase [Planctomycetaceae bacterium]|nr:AAA family ATPase [Planctomycetaceae bacterium]
MYQKFFQLTRRAFSAVPDSSLMHVTDVVDSTMHALEQTLTQGEGIGLLTAPAGIGKTLVCKALRDRLACNCSICSGSDREDASIASESPAGPIPVLLLQPQFPTRSSLLQAILFELNQPYARMTEQELRLELISYGRDVSEKHHGIAIIVDEAHLLGEHILEELRGLTNYMYCTVPIFRVVLSGQLALEETLTSRAMEAINQRLGCHVTLESLSRQQSVEYIETRIQACGAKSSDLFTDEAIELIVRAADGLPRCLNQLCDHTCLLASLSGDKPVNGDHVREALDDLMKLPLHWNALPARLDPVTELRGLKQSCGDCGNSNCECSHSSEESVVEISLQSDSTEINEPEVYETEPLGTEQSHVFETSTTPVPETVSEPAEMLTEASDETGSNDASGSTTVFEIGGDLPTQPATSAVTVSSETEKRIDEIEDGFEEVKFEQGYTTEDSDVIESVNDQQTGVLEIGASSETIEQIVELAAEAPVEIERDVSQEINNDEQDDFDQQQVGSENTWEENVHDRYAVLDAQRLGQVMEVASTAPDFIEGEFEVPSSTEEEFPGQIVEFVAEKEMENEEELEHRIGQSILDLTTELSAAISGVDGDIIPNPEDVIVTASESLLESEVEYDVIEPETESDSEYSRLHRELRKRDQELE